MKSDSNHAYDGIDIPKQSANLFARAEKSAAASKYEVAIEYYLMGLKLMPDAVESHWQLREVALKRKAAGGKPLRLFSRVKAHRTHADVRENLVNVERVLAYDPGNVAELHRLYQIARAMKLEQTTSWLKH